jgi:hypothetical protein
MNSTEYIQQKKDIESLKYRNSVEYDREREFLKMQKSKDIVLYFGTIAGQTLGRFRSLDGSEKIRSFEDLEHEVKSLEFRQKMKVKKFKETEDFRKLQEYKRLKASTEIREYYKFKSSKEYANFPEH